jgi:hypothetical protein
MVDPLLFREVEEPTALLRHAPDWQYVRDFVTAQGLDPGEVLLAGFMEDEEWGEYGCLVTPDGAVLHYERRLEEHPEGPRTNVWRERTGDPTAAADWPALEAALVILGRGEAPGSSGRRTRR